MSVKKTVNALESPDFTVGCFVKGGAVYPAYALTDAGAALPSGTKYVQYSRAAGKYCACTQGTMYLSSDGVQFTSCTNIADFSPYLLEDYDSGVQRAVFVSGQVAAVIETETEVCAMLKKLDCAVVHCGRVFGARGLAVHWSGADGWNDWTGGLNGCGHLLLDPARGKALNIFVFSGRLAVVREYGVTVLNMFGSPENFSVGITDTDCDRIYKNTACVVGDKLYFYSSSGLKSFDGSRISAHKTGFDVTEPVGAAEYAGKYFLVCRSSRLGRNAVLVYAADGESCLIDYAADGVFVRDGVYVFGAGGVKKLESGGSLRFESAPIDFGTGRSKTVTAIDVSGTADITLSDGNFSRKFSSVSGVIRPHMRGKKFKVTAESSGALKSVSVTAEVTDAV